MNSDQLKKLFKTTERLKMNNLMEAVLSMIACKVMVGEKGITEAQKKRLGVKIDFSYAEMRRILQRHPEYQKIVN